MPTMPVEVRDLFLIDFLSAEARDELNRIIEINLESLLNQKVKAKKDKKHWLLKMQRDFLKEDKIFLMVLEAKYFQ